MRSRRFALRVGLSASLLAGIAGCSAQAWLGHAPAARRPNTIPPERLQDNPRLAEGERLFMQHCNQCHVGGAAGVGPSLNDKPLPPWALRIQVRHGFGAMPAYSSKVLNDRELEDVITYVRYLRFHPEHAIKS